MGSDLQTMMIQISAAFLLPLREALGGVAEAALPLLDSVMILCIGLSALYAGIGGQMPVGSLIQSFLTIGIAQAAINFWPTIINSTIDQAGVLGGMAGSSSTDPFSVLVAGAALASLAFDHAGAIMSYFSGWVTGPLFILAGLLIFIAYLIISALSLMAWVEFWAAAVILSPLVALLPVVGFNNAGFVPLSFLISSTMRIVAISLIAAYGTDLIAQFAIPPTSEPVTWLHAFIAVGLAGVLLGLAWQANSLIGGVLMGRPGWAGGLGAVKTAVVSAATGMMGGMSAAAASVSAKGGGGGGTSSGGGASSSGVGSTSTPVNSRQASSSP